MFNKNTIVDSSNDNSKNFMEKFKKQSKNLLKISQGSNNFIKVDNLSQAQEIMAKINGYPNYHALITSRNNIASNEKIHYPLNVSYSNLDIETLTFKEKKVMDFLDKDKTTHVSSIIGRIGSGKSFFIEKTIRENFINGNTPLKVGYVGFDFSKEIMDFISEDKRFLLINFFKNDTFNPLEKELGFRKMTDEHIYDLSCVFMETLFKNIHENISVSNRIKMCDVFFKIIFKLLEFYDTKAYSFGEINSVDKALLDMQIIDENFVPSERFTWADVSHQLFIASMFDEAYEAKIQSDYTLKDIWNFISSNNDLFLREFNKNLMKPLMLVLKKENLDTLLHNIKSIITDYPNLIKATNVNVNKKHQFVHVSSDDPKIFTDGSDLMQKISLFFIRKNFFKDVGLFHNYEL